MLHLKRKSIAVLALIVLAAVLSRAQVESETERLSLTGHVVTGYMSLCDVKPQRSPKTVSMGPGASYSITFPQCPDFDKRSLVPVEITATNRQSKPATFRVPLLSEVSIKVGQRSESAVALFIPWDSQPAFSTKITGVFNVTIDPGQSVGFLYLLPRVAEKGALQVEGYPVISLKK